MQPWNTSAFRAIWSWLDEGRRKEKYEGIQAKKKKKADAQALKDKKKADAQALKDKKKKKAKRDQAGRAKVQQRQELAAAMWGKTKEVSVGCTWLELDSDLWMREFSFPQAKEMIKSINQVVYSSSITHESPSIRQGYQGLLFVYTSLKRHLSDIASFFRSSPAT